MTKQVVPIANKQGKENELTVDEGQLKEIQCVK